jgi:hypothetical protein
MAALAIDAGNEQELWLANLTADTRCAELSGVAPKAMIEVLDEATFTLCCASPNGFASTAKPLKSTTVQLGAYAIVRISWRS